jgi:hypothetical protein
MFRQLGGIDLAAGGHDPGVGLEGRSGEGSFHEGLGAAHHQTGMRVGQRGKGRQAGRHDPEVGRNSLFAG